MTVDYITIFFMITVSGRPLINLTHHIIKGVSTEMNAIFSLEFDGLQPTLNSMYRSAGTRRYKRNVITEWQEDISELMENVYSANQTLTLAKEKSDCQDYQKPYTGGVEVRIVFTVKDRRKWDIDNRLKALLDCLQFAKVIENDSQIERISACRKRGEKNSTRIELFEY